MVRRRKHKADTAAMIWFCSGVALAIAFVGASLLATAPVSGPCYTTETEHTDTV